MSRWGVWLDVARVALHAGDGERRAPSFAAGKLVEAQYFLLQELPLLDAWRRPLSDATYYGWTCQPRGAEKE